jgi:ABC-type antimicrobial peptide transport system permease subunit
VHTASEPFSLVPAIRQIITDINPNVPITDIKTQAIQLDESIANERCFAVLAMSLALLAVLLSCVGLFGLMSFYTTQRTGEIGIRMALGAQPWDVGFSVMRNAVSLVLIGAVIGIPLILATSRLIRSYLFGIEPYDPFSIAGATILLVLVSLVAVWLPIRRAAKIDPMEALRYE